MPGCGVRRRVVLGVRRSRTADRPGHGTGSPTDPGRGSEHDNQANDVRAQPHQHRHGQLTSSYPDSSTAAATLASSSAASLVTVTVPAVRSTCTSGTPGFRLTSDVTALTQCPHVMPATV